MDDVIKACEGHVCTLGDINVFITVAPCPSTPQCECNFDNDIMVTFIDSDNNSVVVSMPDLLRAGCNSGYAHDIYINNTLLSKSVVCAAERRCWRYLYQNFGYLPAVYNDDDMKFFVEKDTDKETVVIE